MNGEELGFVLDIGDGGKPLEAKWIEGQPEPRSFWTGVKIKGKKQVSIQAFRCPRCGLLANYANDSVSVIDLNGRKVIAELDLRPGKNDTAQKGVPGGEYPPHTHAGVEELHLLDGELWIDERRLFPGDYYYGAPGASDDRVWSETGCTCLLVTSTKDILG